jgi:hypothetical protein
MSDMRMQPEGEEGEKVRNLEAYIELLEERIRMLGGRVTQRSIIPFADESVGFHLEDSSRRPFGLSNLEVQETAGKIVRIAHRDLAFARLDANDDVVALTRELGAGDELRNRGFEPQFQGRQVVIRRDAESGATIGFSLQPAAASQTQEGSL